MFNLPLWGVLLKMFPLASGVQFQRSFLNCSWHSNIPLMVPSDTARTACDCSRQAINWSWVKSVTLAQISGILVNLRILKPSARWLVNVKSVNINVKIQRFCGEKELLFVVDLDDVDDDLLTCEHWKMHDKCEFDGDDGRKVENVKG